MTLSRLIRSITDRNEFCEFQILHQIMVKSLLVIGMYPKSFYRGGGFETFKN
jgi:hypothetical protein